MAEDEISKLKQDLTNLQGELESLDQKKIVHQQRQF